MYGKRYWGIIRSHFVIDEAGHIVDARYGVKPGAGVSGALVALGVQ